ncbi:hypothetical protein H9P43_006818 [Blastocladiella emersonii ATCC 22665]|nr:hypothetical protein H9P43_006818 [Blastocladiella emersonii ATCC 22665]
MHWVPPFRIPVSAAALRNIPSCQTILDAREFLSHLRAALPNTSVALALLATRSRVPHRLFFTYAVLLRESTADEEATRLFLGVADGTWNPDWVAQWLQVRPTAPTRDAVWAYYDQFCAVLNKVVKVTYQVEREEHVKRVFAKLLFYKPRWDMAPLASILQDPGASLKNVVAASVALFAPPTRLQSQPGPSSGARAGCTFCDDYKFAFETTKLEHPPHDTLKCPLLDQPARIATLFVRALGDFHLDPQPRI